MGAVNTNTGYELIVIDYCIHQHVACAPKDDGWPRASTSTCDHELQSALPLGQTRALLDDLDHALEPLLPRSVGPPLLPEAELAGDLQSEGTC